MAPSGYSSPVESDTIQTPCVDHGCEVLLPGMPKILHQQDENDHHHKGPHTLVISPIVNDSDLPRYSTLFPLDVFLVSEDVLVQSFSDLFTINVGCSQNSPSILSGLSPCPPKILDDLQPEQCHHPCYNATFYSPNFPVNHKLNSRFVRAYALSDELGSGGYGFVMTAHHRTDGYEVAIKFIIKKRVPDHAWMENDVYGRLPTEVVLLSLLDHENIVKCLDLFEDSLYFYLVRSHPFTQGDIYLPYLSRFKSFMAHHGTSLKGIVLNSRLLPGHLYLHIAQPPHYLRQGPAAH